MATRAEQSCAICREVARDIAYLGSCLHRFCRTCIVRWAMKNPSCPLCRKAVRTIVYSAPLGQRFVEMAMPQPPLPYIAGPREELGAVGPLPQPQPHVAGFPIEMWALFFHKYSEIQRPLELWLSEVLRGACSWDADVSEGQIVTALCRYGLHEEALVRELQPFLQEDTVDFVKQLIEVVVNRCCELARHYAGPIPGTAVSQQDMAVATPSTAPSPATSIVQGELHEEPGFSQAEALGAEVSGAEASDAEASGAEASGAVASVAEASGTVASGTVALGTEASGTEPSGTEVSDAEPSGAAAAEPMQTRGYTSRAPRDPARHRSRPSRGDSGARKRICRRQN